MGKASPPTLNGLREGPRRVCVPGVLGMVSCYLLQIGRLGPGPLLQMEPFSVLPSFFKKDVIFIYLFLEKGEGREKREGREKEGERNIDVREKC